MLAFRRFERVAHHGFAIAVALIAGNSGDVVDTGYALVDHDGGGGYRLRPNVSHIARKSIPYRVGFKHLAEPGERDVEADRTDRAKLFLAGAVTDLSHLQLRKRPARWQQAIGHHSRQIHGMMEPVFRENLAGPAADARFQPIIAYPIGPFLPARLEVQSGEQDLLFQFG